MTPVWWVAGAVWLVLYVRFWVDGLRAARAWWWAGGAVEATVLSSRATLFGSAAMVAGVIALIYG